MAFMVNIDRSTPIAEPIIRIYPEYFSLNARAVELLGLSPGDRIYVRINAEEKSCGRNRLYLAKAHCLDPLAYTLIWRKDRLSARVCRKSLCKAMSEALSGPGAYRICREVTEVFEGKTYYNIFFRKYDK